MFKFLKEKLKSAISKISEGVEKEGKVEENIIEKSIEEVRKEDKGFFAKLKEKFVGKEEAEEVEKEKKQVIGEKKAEIKEKAELKKEEKPIIIEHVKKEQQKTKDEIKPIIKKIEEPKIKYEEPIKKPVAEIPKKLETEKKGFFATITEKIITTKINEEQFEKLFWELELALMENNVAVEVIEKIKNDLKGQLVNKPIKRMQVENTISLTL